MNRKHVKRYWLLISPFLVVALLLASYLPQQYKVYSLLVLVVFWIVYYGWIYRKNDNGNKSNDETDEQM